MKCLKRWWTPVVGSTLIAVVAACGGDPTETTQDRPAPQIHAFDGAPSSITSGTNVRGNNVQGEVLLEWDVEGAASIALFANGDPVDLSGCESADDGEDCLAAGSISLSPDEPTTYRLDSVNHEELSCVFRDSGEVSNLSACDSAIVDVDVMAPALLSFHSDTDRFDQDHEFVISYEVEHALEFELGILDGDDFEACEVDSSTSRCSIDGDDAGQLTLRDLEEVESILLTGWASNGADDGLGEVELGDVTLELSALGTPIVRAFDADPSHVAFGGSSEFSWHVEDANSVELTSDADVVIASDLSECFDVDTNGEGGCEVHFAEEAPEMTITFTLVAHGDEGKESSPMEIPVVLGAAPEIVSFDIDPVQLPETGGDVTLSWETVSEPSRLMIIDDADPANTLLDTDDGTGIEYCQSSADECDFEADSFVVADVEVNTQFTLVVSSPLGSDSSNISVTIEGAPAITSLEVDGQDVVLGPAMVDAASADLTWTTEETDSTELFRAERPDDGCSSPDLDWEEVEDFSGEASGSDQISDLDVMHLCFRLRALGEADQSASAIFEVVRHPEIESFDAAPQTLQTGDQLNLDWVAPFATEVEISVSPQGSVSASDLGECSDVDESDHSGSCEVTIQPGSPAGDVTFSLIAYGFDESEVGPEHTVITIGSAPEVLSFGSNPSTAPTEVADITLSWSTTDGVEVSISDDDGEIFFSDDAAEVAGGQHIVQDLDATTTWTLVVSNQYGSDSASATTFFGPAVESLEVNGEDALGGEATVLTGDVFFEWTTSNADESELERADIPGGDDGCEDADGWELLESFSTGDGDFTEADVVENGCYRLSLSNNAGQSSAVTFLVTEVPYLTSMTTNVDSIDGENGGTVTVEMSFVGVSDITVRAWYRDEDGNDVDDTVICTQNNLNSGSLDASNTDEDTVTCTHTMDGPCTGLGCLATSDDPHSDTDYIEYEVEFADPEGDGGVEITDEGENVGVDW